MPAAANPSKDCNASRQFFAGVAEGLTEAGFNWAFTVRHSINWQPLICLSHRLTCQLIGLNSAAVAMVEKTRAAAIGQAVIAQKNAELLELYRSGKTFHQTS